MDKVQKLTLQLNTTIDAGTAQDSANKIKDILKKAGVSESVLKSADALASKINVIGKKIEAINKQGFVNEADLKRLPVFFDDIENSLKDMAELSNKINFAESPATEKLKKEIEDIKKASTDAITKMKSSFAGGAEGILGKGKGIKFDDAQNTLIALESQINALTQSKDSLIKNQKAAMKQYVLDAMKAEEDITGEKFTSAKKYNEFVKSQEEQLAQYRKAGRTVAERRETFKSQQKDPALEEANYQKLLEQYRKRKDFIEIINSGQKELNRLQNEETNKINVLISKKDQLKALTDQTAASVANEEQQTKDVLDLKNQELVVEQNLLTTAKNITQQGIGGAISAGLGPINAARTSVADMSQKFSQLKGVSTALQNPINTLTSSFTRLTSATYLFYKAFSQIKKSASVISQLDNQITQIGVVTKQTTDEIWSTFDVFNKAAFNLGSTTKQYLEGAKIFYQQGMNTAEVMQMVEATTKAAALSEVSFAAASETLTASIRAYNMEASQAASVTDKFAAVGAQSAADFQELSTAMEKVASSAYTSGMSFDSLLGILAKGIETTREAPEAIGTALKTIIARFQEMKENPMADLEDGVNANRVEKALSTVGVALRDTNGEFRNLDDVFADLGERWKTLSRNQKAYISTMAAGSRQQSRFMAIMNNYDRTLQLIRTSTNSAGEADAQYAVYLGSVEAAQNKLTNSFEKFYSQITSASMVKGFYGFLTSILDIVNKANPVVLALGGSFAFLTGKILTMITASKIEMGADLLSIISKNKLVQSIYSNIGALVVGKTVTDANTMATSQNTVATLGNSIGVLTEAEAREYNTAKTVIETQATLQGAAAKTTAKLAALGFAAAIALVIAGTILLIKYLEAQKNKVHEVAIEQAKLAQEERQRINNINSQLSRYEELNKNLNRNKEESAELLEITNKIADEMPDLVDSVDEEGNVVLKSNEAIRESIKLKEQSVKETEKLAIETKLASMAAAEWNATLEKGAVGSQTVQQSTVLEKRIKQFNFSQFQAPETLKIGTEEILAGSYATEAERTININSGEIVKYLEGTSQKSLDTIFKELENQVTELKGQERKKAEELLTRLKTDVEKYYKIKEIETKNVMMKYLASVNNSEIEMMRLNNEKVSNEYIALTNSFTKLSVDQATKLADQAVKEGTLQLKDRASYIQQISGAIFDEMKKNIDQYKDLPSFDKSLEEIYDAKKAGKSLKEVEELVSKFQIQFRGINARALFNITGEEDLKKEVSNIVKTVGKTIGITITSDLKEIPIIAVGDKLAKDIEEGLIKTFSNVSQQTKTFLTQTISDLTKAEGATLTKALSDLRPEQAKRLNDLLKNVQTDPKALRDFLTRELSVYPDLVNKVMANALADITTQLNNIKTAYAEIKKLRDEQQKSMSGGLAIEEGADLAQEYGARNISAIGESLLVDFAVTESKIAEQRNKIIKEFDSIIQNKRDQITQNANNPALENQLNAEISGYQKLSEAMQATIDKQKIRLQNQDVLQGIQGINVASNQLKDYGSLLEKVTSGEMNFFDTISAVANNPDLISALEITNKGLRLTKEGIIEVARQKQAETITFLEGERTKVEANIAFVQSVVDNQGEITDSSINSIQSQIDAQDALANADSQSTKAYVDNRNIEIRVINEKNKALAETARLEGKSLGEAKQVGEISTTGISKAQITGASYLESLKTRYGVKDNNKLLSILQKQKTSLDNLIAGFRNITPEQMLKKLSGQGKGGKDFEAKMQEIDKYINYLERIEVLKNRISEIDAKIELGATGAAEDLQLTEQKVQALVDQKDALEELVSVREKDLAQQAEFLATKSGGLVKFENGLLNVRWDLINSYKPANEAQQAWIDGLVKSIEEYQTAEKELSGYKTEIDATAKALEDIRTELVNNVVETRQKIYDALVEADQAEIDATREKYDAMAEAQNKYLEAVKNAIDQERQARSDAEKEVELQTKKRRLATLMSETSGRYSKEVAALQLEISKEEQTLREEQVDRQLEELQKQYQLQQEQRDLEIEMLELQMEVKKDNGMYWQNVDDAIKNGPEALKKLLTSTQEFQQADPLKQQQMMTDINNMVTQVEKLYEDGLKTSSTSVVNAINQGINNILNKISTTNTPNYTQTTATGGGGGTPTGGRTPTSGGTIISGSNVKSIQSALNLSVDGKFGPKTGDAIMVSLINAISTEMQYGRLDQQLGNNYLGKVALARSSKTITSDIINLLSEFVPTLHKYMINGPKTPWSYSTSKQFKTGGLANYTGPAWVDGTPSKPEAFLSSRQTELFAQLRDTMSRITTPGSNISGLGNSINIGDININLANRVDATADEIAKMVQKEILGTFKNRVVTTVQGVR